MTTEQQKRADAMRAMTEVGLKLGRRLNEQMQEFARAVNAGMAEARKQRPRP